MITQRQDSVVGARCVQGVRVVVVYITGQYDNHRFKKKKKKRRRTYCQGEEVSILHPQDPQLTTALKRSVAEAKIVPYAGEVNKRHFLKIQPPKL